MYKCMQIQIAFRQYNNNKKNQPHSLRSLEVKLHVHVYIFFLIEIACFDFNDCHLRM